MFIVWTVENGNFECYKVGNEFEVSTLIYEVRRDGGSIWSINYINE